MTRLQAGILALLARRPETSLALAIALDERIPDVARELNRMSAAGVVEHGEDGWALVEEVAA